jgi:hypothetical protein
MAATFDYSKFLADTGELERAKFLSSIQHNKARELRESLQNMALAFGGRIPYSHGSNRKGHTTAAIVSALASLAFGGAERRRDEENNRRLAQFIAKDKADKEAKVEKAYSMFKSDVGDERLFGLQKEAQRQQGLKDIYREKNRNALDIANVHKDATIKSALAKASSKSSKEGAVSGLSKDLQMAAKRISNPNEMMAYLKSNGNLPLEEITEPSKWLGIPVGKKGTGRYKIAGASPLKGSRLKSILKATSRNSLTPGYQSYFKKAKQEDPTLSYDDIQKMYNDYLTQGM